MKLFQNNKKETNQYLPELERLSFGSTKTNNEEFEKNGYLIVRNLCDPKDLYCEIPKEKTGSIKYITKDQYQYNPQELQVPGSLARYNFPNYKYHHSQVRIKLQEIIGSSLFNTYYYDRFYYTGQELKKHMDRDSCEISVTVHISSNTDKCWPIWIKTPNVYNEDRTKIIKKGEDRSICLNPGDGVIYKGCEVPHWRNPLKSKYNLGQRLLRKIMKKEDDTYYHQVFFHYVLSEGKRCHFAGD